MRSSSFSRTVLRRGGLAAGWAVCGLALALASAASAYVLEGYRWPNNQTIALGLRLGGAQGTLIDGSASWDQVVQDAAGIWNPYLGDGVQLAAQPTNAAPAQRDGKNTVFFASSVYGEDFGDDTLATTVSFFSARSGLSTEADVIFNSAVSFNSYRGPLRSNGGAKVYDLRRIALHELGHVLGLDHVAQNSPSIMTPSVTNIDTLQADDIAGVEAIYGNPNPAPPVINSQLNATGIVGQNFTYRISANNFPTSYQASGLPPGVRFDPTFGYISGTPTAAGTYEIAIGATNRAGTGTATLRLVIAETIKITSDLNLNAYVGRPYYYQITTTGQPTSFKPLNGPIPAGLALNTYTGLISGTPNAAGDFRFQVEVTGPGGYDEETFELVIAYDATLSVVQSVADVAVLLRGSDGNLYGATPNSGQSHEGTIFKLTPGGTQTTLGEFAYPGMFSPTDLHQAADGSLYGATKYGGANLAGGVFKIAADGTITTLINFPALPPDSSPRPLCSWPATAITTAPFDLMCVGSPILAVGFTN